MEEIFISDLSLKAATKNYNFHRFHSFTQNRHIYNVKFHKDLGHGNLIPFTSKAESLLI